MLLNLALKGPKPVERSIDEKHSSGISKRSNRLEEELFSDAVEEFIDSGSYTNVLSSTLVDKLKLSTMPYPQPYKL